MALMEHDVLLMEHCCFIMKCGVSTVYVNPEVHGEKRRQQIARDAQKDTQEHDRAKKMGTSPRCHLRAGNELESF